MVFCCEEHVAECACWCAPETIGSVRAGRDAWAFVLVQYVREQRSGGVAGYWVDDKHFVGNVGYRCTIQRADGVATPVHTVARTKQAIENLCVSVAVIALLDR